MPSIARFVLLHCALGFAIGVAFAALVVLANFAGLYDLISRSSDALTALIMLLVFSGLTAGSLVAGGAIMTLPYDEG